jgi:DNA-binding IclR family transcriptional regulator
MSRRRMLACLADLAAATGATAPLGVQERQIIVVARREAVAATAATIGVGHRYDLTREDA